MHQFIGCTVNSQVGIRIVAQHHFGLCVGRASRDIIINPGEEKKWMENEMLANFGLQSLLDTGLHLGVVYLQYND